MTVNRGSKPVARLCGLRMVLPRANAILLLGWRRRASVAPVTVKVRPHKSGGREVYLVIQLGTGQLIRKRLKSPNIFSSTPTERRPRAAC